ncbi:MAG: hypothetical protein M0C28_03095 [Candidatus Moduliflexus flocculans]|nr:hypothetical protein [Candidatus Moduliflexus flocculans]
MRILVTGATGFVGSVLDARARRALRGRRPSTPSSCPATSSPAAWRDAGVRVVRRRHRRCRGRARGRGRPRPRRPPGRAHLLLERRRGQPAAGQRGRRPGRSSRPALATGVERLVHVSSVGAVGFHRGRHVRPTRRRPSTGRADILYMASKRRGQDIVERGRPGAGPARPSSSTRPRSWDRATTIRRRPHNALYRRICRRTQIGSLRRRPGHRRRPRPRRPHPQGARGGGPGRAELPRRRRQPPLPPRSSGASPGPAAGGPIPSPCRLLLLARRGTVLERIAERDRPAAPAHGGLRPAERLDGLLRQRQEPAGVRPRLHRSDRTIETAELPGCDQDGWR